MAGRLSKWGVGEGKQQFGWGRSGVEQIKETHIIEGRAMREWEREWKGEEGSVRVDVPTWHCLHVGNKHVERPLFQN